MAVGLCNYTQETGYPEKKSPSSKQIWRAGSGIPGFLKLMENQWVL
jgi:hypothetical protein